MRNHKKLKVFALADTLAIRVYSVTKRFPRDEQFGLRSQVRRAAVSIVANIVEGAARASDADFARLLVIAYGSARELEYELSLATRLGYLDPAAAKDLEDMVCQTARALRALVVAVSGAYGRNSPSG